MLCKAPNTPMVFLRVGEIAPARDGNDLLVDWKANAMVLMGGATVLLGKPWV